MQSLSPKIDELIALIQVQNFDVIALNETWLDTQNKHLLAEDSIHGYKVFHVAKQTPNRRRGGSIMYVKNTLNPIDCFLEDALGVLFCPFWSTVLPFGARLPIHTLDYWTV